MRGTDLLQFHGCNLTLQLRRLIPSLGDSIPYRPGKLNLPWSSRFIPNFIVSLFHRRRTTVSLEMLKPFIFLNSC